MDKNVKMITLKEKKIEKKNGTVIKPLTQKKILKLEILELKTIIIYIMKV